LGAIECAPISKSVAEIHRHAPKERNTGGHSASRETGIRMEFSSGEAEEGFHNMQKTFFFT
jgi:hypothetical protein